MPRFRLDVSDGRCATDAEIAEFPDERDALREAIRRAAILVKAAHPDDGIDWKIHVRDAAGNVIFWIDTRLGRFPVRQ